MTFILLFSVSLFAKTYVAVVETMASSEILTREERAFITDKLRESANNVLGFLPEFSVMTNDNIRTMLPKGKSIEDCEGQCLVETGKNINADFIAQARVVKFSGSMAITVELYETGTGKLVGNFTGRGYDAEELLEIVESNADGMFRMVSGGATPDYGFSGEGISGISKGSSYSKRGEKRRIVSITSKPSGAQISIDGRPQSGCRQTPCKVELLDGKHYVSLAMNMYSDFDTSFTVSEYNKELEVYLKPNFGSIKIAPKMDAQYKNMDNLMVVIDGKTASEGVNKLSPGKHKVRLQHRCFEPVEFEVSLKKGSELVYDKKMTLAMGGLDLSAIRNGEPSEETLYVDDDEWGETPYVGSVPVCGTLTIGHEREKLPIKIRRGEDSEYTWRASSYGYSGSKNYNQSYSSSSKTYSSKPNAGDDAGSAFNFGIRAGFLGNLLGGKEFMGEYSDEVTMYMTLAYGVATLNFHMSKKSHIGFGIGLGYYFPMAVVDDEYNYGYNHLTQEEVDEMMPSGEAALVASADIGLTSFKETEQGSNLDFGLRVKGIFSSSWPSYGASLYVEMMILGMELGYMHVGGNGMGNALEIGIYFRFPSKD